MECFAQLLADCCLSLLCCGVCGIMCTPQQNVVEPQARAQAHASPLSTIPPPIMDRQANRIAKN